MRAAGVQSADAVVLGLPARAAFPYSDAQLLSALFMVQSLAAEAEHKVHVVAKVWGRGVLRSCIKEQKFWRDCP